jgi:hypothetical protein
MGEAAEDAIERGMDEWLSGAYEDDPDFCLGTSPRTCRYCKKGGLHWKKRKQKWILCEPNGRLHNCVPLGTLTKERKNR